jgi:hypothetical protein
VQGECHVTKSRRIDLQDRGFWGAAATPGRERPDIRLPADGKLLNERIS